MQPSDYTDCLPSEALFIYLFVQNFQHYFQSPGSVLYKTCQHYLLNSHFTDPKHTTQCTDANCHLKNKSIIKRNKMVIHLVVWLKKWHNYYPIIVISSTTNTRHGGCESGSQQFIAQALYLLFCVFMVLHLSHTVVSLHFIQSCILLCCTIVLEKHIVPFQCIQAIQRKDKKKNVT